jgi:hypothetical protein
VHLQKDHISVCQDRLNPIFDYAAQGQCCEKQMAWQDAVRWYERSLACLPNLFGADKKIRPLPLAQAKGISFSPQHASRLYEALGRALMAMDRSQDCILAYRAAQALDPKNLSAQRFIQANADMLKTSGVESGAGKAGHWVGSAASNQTIGKDLTLVMVTHCTDRLKKFEALSPPSDKLVTATYGSLLEIVGEDIAACPKVMCYDHNPGGSLRDKQYTRSLESFCAEHGFELRTFQGVGLFNVLNRIVPTIESHYTLFTEHDWMFRGSRIHLPAIIEMMNDEPNINAIRFNKRDNYLNGQDFLMNVDAASKRYPLMRTASYSNNPSIIRTDKLKNEWLPICEEALHRVSDKLGGSAFGVEEILFKKYVRDIRAQGFHKAHEKWRTYVFGGLGDTPRIIHLGE